MGLWIASFCRTRPVPWNCRIPCFHEWWSLPKGVSDGCLSHLFQSLFPVGQIWRRVYTLHRSRSCRVRAPGSNRGQLDSDWMSIYSDPVTSCSVGLKNPEAPSAMSTADSWPIDHLRTLAGSFIVLWRMNMRNGFCQQCIAFGLK